MLRRARRLHCVRPPAGPLGPARAQRPRGRRPASLQSPRRCGRPRRRGSSSGACSQLRPLALGPSGPTQWAGMPRAPELPSAGRGPLSRRPVRGAAAEPAPATPARDARPRPRQPLELEMPPWPQPPPSAPVPLPHVGRAATAAATTISGPLPLPLSLTDSRPHRPSPRCSAHARPAHAAAANPGHAHDARAWLAGLRGGGGGGSGRALRLHPLPRAAPLQVRPLGTLRGGMGWLWLRGPVRRPPVHAVRSPYPLWEI